MVMVPFSSPFTHNHQIFYFSPTHKFYHVHVWSFGQLVASSYLRYNREVLSSGKAMISCCVGVIWLVSLRLPIQTLTFAFSEEFVYSTYFEQIDLYSSIVFVASVSQQHTWRSCCTFFIQYRAHYIGPDLSFFSHLQD